MSEDETKFSPEVLKRFSLEDILDRTKQIPKEYQAIIARQSKQDADFDTAYSDRIKFLYNEAERQDLSSLNKKIDGQINFLYELMRERLQGAPLIDLGGGKGYMSNIAHQNSPSAYINVDYYKIHTAELNPFVPAHDATETSGPAFMVVRADMLDFASRIKDNSVNFVINGIEGTLIPDEEYHKALAEEIYRAAKPGGLIFGVDATALDIISEKVKRGQIKLAEDKLPDLDKFVQGLHVFEVIK